jgi:hypothetical protein
LRDYVKTTGALFRGDSKKMARRNPDGTYRNNNTASRVSNTVLIARWVEAEVLEIKQYGFSYARASRHITAVGRGQESPLTPFFPGMTFSPGYKISAAACQKAHCRALDREVKLGAEHLRKELMLRCDLLWSAAQPAIRRGDPRAMMVGVRAVETMWSMGGTKSGTTPEPTNYEPDPPQYPVSGAVVDLFAAAVKGLLDLGVDVPAIPGYRFVAIEPEPKAIETTARKNDQGEEEPVSASNQKEPHDPY